MRRLTTGICSEKCVVRRFRLCVNVYLHTPKQYSIAFYTPRLYGIVYCSWVTNLYSMLLYWILWAIVTQWYYYITLLVCGPGSSVGVATDYGLDGPGSNPGRDEIFPPVQTGPGAHSASCKMGTGSFPGVKCSRGVLLPTSSAAVMEE